MKEARRKKTGRRVPCPGSAHSNPFIDNCGLCAPAWGELVELAPIDLAAARAAGLVVRVCDLTPEQFDEVKAQIKAGEAEYVNVERRNVNYYVVRWITK